jgi:WD40 repeat protein/transcriptional regulator with XRE-family HTH domain
VAEQPSLSFGRLLRQLRADARLTQEELAEASGLSPRSISDLERGINRTARQETALLLAGALGLAGPPEKLFVAAARGRAPAAEVLAAVHRARPPPQVAAIASPYRGLSAFGEQDAPFFFGREAATTEVLDRLARLLAGGGLLVVSGVSGAGKSSLLRAGVLPQIRAAGLAGAPGAASWQSLLLTPTRAPLAELALHVAGPAGTDAAGLRRELEARPEGFALAARQAARARPRGPAQRPAAAQRPPGAHDPGQRRLLLVVDQFEELFTQCADEGQRRAFVTALHAAAAIAQEPGQAPAALVVLGVRADFEAGCADYPQLAGAVQDRYLVTAMTERQLRMAISEPAKKAGSTVDDDLVSVLLAEMRNGQPGTTGAGVLPLLSHALDQAWRSRTGNTVTLADYERTGGIEGAVATSAQRTYDALTPSQQVVARQLFTRLAVPTTDGADTTDRATRVELTTGKEAAEVRDLDAVLEAFAAERLLTLAAGTVEISHEVLLTAWPLLRDTWLADTLADRIIRTRLRSTAAEWERHSRDPSYLYSGSLLEAATSTAARAFAAPARHGPLSHAERDFLRASEHAHQRSAHKRQAAIAGLLVLTLTAITAAGFALHNAAVAAQQHALGLSRLLVGESLLAGPTDPVIARQLAVAAWHVFPTSQAGSLMSALLTEQEKNGILPVLHGTPNSVDSVAFSPNGKLLASGGPVGTVRLLKMVTGQRASAPIPLGPGGGGPALAFSPGGNLLACVGADGVVRLWNPLTGRPADTAIPAGTGAGHGVVALGFSPDGQQLATVGADGTVQSWSPVTGESAGELFPGASAAGGRAAAVGFSPDGTLVAIADAHGMVRVWHPFTGVPFGRPFPAGPSVSGGVAALVFSPDSRSLAVVGGDGSVRLWNPRNGQPVGAPFPAGTGPGDGADKVAFSPRGGLLATAGAGGMIRLWNPVTGQPAGAPISVGTGRYRGVLAVAFSPHGGLLASADADGTVRLWDVSAFLHPDAALCAGAGPLTQREWNRYAPGEPEPRIC